MKLPHLVLHVMYVCNTPDTGCHHLGYLFLRGWRWHYVLFIPNMLLLLAGPLGGREKSLLYCNVITHWMQTGNVPCSLKVCHDTPHPPPPPHSI